MGINFFGMEEENGQRGIWSFLPQLFGVLGLGLEHSGYYLVVSTMVLALEKKFRSGRHGAVMSCGTSCLACAQLASYGKTNMSKNLNTENNRET